MKNASDAILHVSGAIRAQLNRPITTAIPQFPPAESVRGRVLGRLLRGRMMTNGDVWRELSASRLAATVYQLRREFGWDIRSHRIRVRTRDNGRLAQIHKPRPGYYDPYDYEPAVLDAMRHLVEKHPETGDMLVSEAVPMSQGVKNTVFGAEVQDLPLREALKRAQEVNHD